jgi:hypothetical protein
VLVVIFCDPVELEISDTARDAGKSFTGGRRREDHIGRSTNSC